MTDDRNVRTDDHGTLYGERLANDERYAGRPWDDFEADARSDWERDNKDTPWENVKDSVRNAWERIRK
jgi:hypothetical protein